VLICIGPSNSLGLATATAGRDVSSHHGLGRWAAAELDLAMMGTSLATAVVKVMSLN
jgi:hypothetical protein